MAIEAGDFKTGLTVMVDGDPWQVIDFMHVKPGKGAAILKTKMKNLKTGSTQERNFNASTKFEAAMIEKKSAQYSYSAGDVYYFMDMETFDQMEINKSILQHTLKFLVENMNVQVVLNEGRILDVVLPEKLSFEVIEAEPAIKGDTKSGGDKLAKIETGYELRVPLFIEAGERIVINTTTGDYVSREK